MNRRSFISLSGLVLFPGINIPDLTATPIYQLDDIIEVFSSSPSLLDHYKYYTEIYSTKLSGYNPNEPLESIRESNSQQGQDRIFQVKGTEVFLIIRKKLEGTDKSNFWFWDLKKFDADKFTNLEQRKRMERCRKSYLPYDWGWHWNPRELGLSMDEGLNYLPWDLQELVRQNLHLFVFKES